MINGSLLNGQRKRRIGAQLPVVLYDAKKNMRYPNILWLVFGNNTIF
jgi:hypothetical protein